LVLAELLASMDPTTPLQVSQAPPKAAEAAAKARAGAAARPATTVPPPLPNPVALAVPAVVCGNLAAVHWAPKASSCGCALEVTELLHSSSPLGLSGGFLGAFLPPGLVSAHSSRVVALKAKSQAQCFEWVTVLRTLSQQIQKPPQQPASGV